MAKIDNPVPDGVVVRATLTLEDKDGNVIQRSGLMLDIEDPTNYWDRFDKTYRVLTKLLKHEVNKLANVAHYLDYPLDKKQ